METRILVLVSGVEMWNVTPSKSDTTWSMEAGGALELLSGSWGGGQGDGRAGAANKRDAYPENLSVSTDCINTFW